MAFKLFGRVWGVPADWLRSHDAVEVARSNATSTITRPSQWLLNALGGGPTASGIRINTQTALEVSVVYACVRNLCEDVAKLKIGVYQQTEDGGRKKLLRHNLSRLFRRPNFFQDRVQFVEQVMMSLTLRGNAYIVLLRTGRGDVASMVCINPDKVTILESADGMLFYQITAGTAFERRALGDSTTSLLSVPEEDIVHVRLMSFGGLMGLSPIAYARETLGVAAGAERYQAKMLANNARPGGVLKHPNKISIEAAQRLKAQWNDIQGGLDNAGKTAVLEEGMEWQQLGMTSVDAEFMTGRRFTVEEICRFWRMPPHMVGDLSRSTNNNIAQQSTDYLTHTLTPYLERIEAAFDRSFGLDDGVFMEFMTEGLTRGDAKTQAETDKLAREGGWMTANEARVKRGMNPKPGGDVLERPVNKIPADAEHPALKPDPEPAPTEGDKEPAE